MNCQKKTSKKSLYHNVKRKLTTKELAEQTGRGRKPTTQVVQKESDWKTYYGSTKQIVALIKDGKQEDFTREILQFVFNKKLLTYHECKYLFVYGVLENPDKWMNVGADVEHGIWAMYGARLGCWMTNLKDDWDHTNVRDFKYLNSLWNTLETSVTFAGAIGATCISVTRGGVEVRAIATSGVPTDENVSFNSATGVLTFATARPLEVDEFVRMIVK